MSHFETYVKRLGNPDGRLRRQLQEMVDRNPETSIHNGGASFCLAADLLACKTADEALELLETQWAIYRVTESAT